MLAVVGVGVSGATATAAAVGVAVAVYVGLGVLVGVGVGAGAAAPRLQPATIAAPPRSKASRIGAVERLMSKCLPRRLVSVW